MTKADALASIAAIEADPSAEVRVLMWTDGMCNAALAVTAALPRQLSERVDALEVYATNRQIVSRALLELTRPSKDADVLAVAEVILEKLKVSK